MGVDVLVFHPIVNMWYLFQRQQVSSLIFIWVLESWEELGSEAKLSLCMANNFILHLGYHICDSEGSSQPAPILLSWTFQKTINLMATVSGAKVDSESTARVFCWRNWVYHTCVEADLVIKLYAYVWLLLSIMK